MSERVWSILGGSSYGKLCTLYFDGSHNNQANKSGVGCIIIDNQEKFVVAAAYNITESFPYSCNVAIAEATALKKGLELAKEHKINLSIIKGDSKEVIDHVLDCSRRPPKPPLSTIIQQIKGMTSRFSPRIVGINREANGSADSLASWGSSNLLKGGLTFRTFADLPLQVAEVVKQEMLSRRSSKEEDEGEGSSMAANIGKASVAVAGVAMLAWGVSTLFGASGSSDQQEDSKSKTKAKALDTSDFNTYNNYATMCHNKNRMSNNYYVLHFNGSDINQYNKGGAGCIIRNNEELVIAGSYNLDYLNVFPKQFHVAIAGAVALKNGLKLAQQMSVKLDLIKGKNEEVINRVLGRQKRPPEVRFLSELIDEIKRALYELSIDLETQVELIEEGEANEVAHELSSHGSNVLEYASEEIYSWEDDLPPKVAQLLEQDKKMWRAKNNLM